VNKTRFESFSDGVFAFAITLLALGFAVPMHGELKWSTDAALTRELLKLWPNLIAYALSFAVIGIMWQNHHALFRSVARIDRFTVFLNLLQLGSTVLIPFATSMLGFYPTTHAATFLYGCVLFACATLYNALLWHLIRSHAFHESVTPDRIRATVRAYRVGWATYPAATLVALVFPTVSFALYVLIAAYYLIPRGVDDDFDPRRGAPGR
jgi:TMEM175 potassium channel family protein